MSGSIGILGHEDGLAMDDVIGVFIAREGPAIAGREVLQQFNPRPAGARARR